MAKDRHQQHAARSKWEKIPAEKRSRMLSEVAKARWAKNPAPPRQRPCSFLVDGEWLEFGSIKEASESLGISRSTLHYRLRKGKAGRYLAQEP